jgi:GWxTD domain-containing protein
MEGFISNINTKPLFSKYKKIGKNYTEPTLLYFPVNSLRSGDYHILVNIINKEKKSMASRKINFVKSNPIADIAFMENFNEFLENSFVQQIKADELDYVLKAHLPITDQHQVATLTELIKSDKTKSQRQFLFQYWKSKAGTNPGEAYKSYMEVAKAVDKMFYSNVGFGFQSDRGYIFLKYGKPTNVVTIDTETDAVPYEIWYYNYIAQSRQTNVRFLFYNPSLVHNDFKLLHSTCIGEKVNPAWEVELYKSVPAERLGNAIDATKVGENWNRNARRYFNDF